MSKLFSWPFFFLAPPKKGFLRSVGSCRILDPSWWSSASSVWWQISVTNYQVVASTSTLTSVKTSTTPTTLSISIVSTVKLGLFLFFNQISTLTWILVSCRWIRRRPFGSTTLISLIKIELVVPVVVVVVVVVVADGVVVSVVVVEVGQVQADSAEFFRPPTRRRTSTLPETLRERWSGSRPMQFAGLEPNNLIRSVFRFFFGGRSSGLLSHRYLSLSLSHSLALSLTLLLSHSLSDSLSI